MSVPTTNVGGAFTAEKYTKSNYNYTFLMFANYSFDQISTQVETTKDTCIDFLAKMCFSFISTSVSPKIFIDRVEKRQFVSCK